MDVRVGVSSSENLKPGMKGNTNTTLPGDRVSFADLERLLCLRPYFTGPLARIQKPLETGQDPK